MEDLGGPALHVMLTWIIVLSLVTYRVTRFLIEDSLIAAPRFHLKRWISGNEAGIKLFNTPKWRAKLIELSECPYCISVWVALAATLISSAAASVPQPVWVWLATCGGTMMVWTFVEE